MTLIEAVRTSRSAHEGNCSRDRRFLAAKLGSQWLSLLAMLGDTLGIWVCLKIMDTQNGYFNWENDDNPLELNNWQVHVGIDC